MAYIFQRGEDFSFMVEAVGHDIADLAGVIATAVLKKAVAGEAPAADAPVLIVFEVEEVEAQGDVSPGWLFTAPGADTATLATGRYVTNPMLTFPGGAIQKGNALLIQIKPAT